MHPALQSCGIGTLIVDEAERRIHARGLANAEVGVEHDNPRARVLYERLGYVAYADAPEESDAEGPGGEIFRYRTMCTLMRSLSAASVGSTAIEARLGYCVGLCSTHRLLPRSLAS